MRTQRPGLRTAGLTVLYDAHCPVCRQARLWSERNRHLVPLRFVPAGSPLAVASFPDLDVGSTLRDVTVVTDEGAVLRGDRAWIAVLWAVERTRTLAVDLARGRRARLLRGARGATDAIRRLTSNPSGRAPQMTSAAEWAPPGDDKPCPGCRTWYR